MCNQNQPHRHHHGRYEHGRFGRFQSVGRRTFLATVGKGTFALLTEASLARNVITIALGTTGLAACAAPPAASPTTAPSTATEVAATEAPTAMPTSAVGATKAATAVPATEATTAAAKAAATTVAASPLSYNQVNLGFVNAYVLVRGNEVAVVDTGVANSQGKIEEVIKATGRTWADVKHLILTHYHPDHAGSMDAVMGASPNATAYAGRLDIGQIRTALPITAVEDGADVFGLQIIGTPGHTPGHISVYDPVGSAFITGDALGNNNGVLSGPNPQFSVDMQTAIESAKKIGALKFETAYFMHGTTIETGASAAIAALAATLK
jgi:glyoxylase-like metal-dependent hydrolase (beta-lactamase superfamily II)